MVDPVTVAKATVTLLSNEKTRKGIGWVVVVILSPIIVVMALLMLSFNMVADGLREALDPKLKEM